MTDTELKLLSSFPKSYINQHGEFIAREIGNAYFNLKDCNNELDIKSKVLEWLSRDAYKAEPYRQNKKNEEHHNFISNGINRFLETEFTKDDFEIIYIELGNRVNHDLTVKFIESGYNMKILRESD